MPYTAAHIICAAPLWYLSQKRLSLPALMVGCMAPDIPYFFYLTPVPAPGHTISGLFTHALPQGWMPLAGMLMLVANWVHQSHGLQSFAVNSASGAMSGAVVGACLYAAIYYQGLPTEV